MSKEILTPRERRMLNLRIAKVSDEDIAKEFRTTVADVINTRKVIAYKITRNMKNKRLKKLHQKWSLKFN